MKACDQMVAKSSKLLRVSRLLVLLFILFLSLFALDAFSGQASFFMKLAGFLIHMVPSFILLGVLLISYKSPLLSGLIFILLSVLFTLYYDTHRSVLNFLVITFPLAVIGVLFIISQLLDRRRLF